MTAKRFRKLPLEIEAVQWTGDAISWQAVLDFTGRLGAKLSPGGVLHLWCGLSRQWLRVPVGHWVAKGTLGEFYPIDPTALQQTYEEIEEPDDERY